MNVLSIDIDYIMWPDIKMYNNFLYDTNPTGRWKRMEDANYMNAKRKFDIDRGNLMFIYNLFLQAIQKCDSVSFGYEHDAILYELDKEKYKDIDLIHIDHHDDYVNGWYDDEGYKGFEKEFVFVEHQYYLDEGNWAAWLKQHKKLKSFLWVHNPNVKFDLKHPKVKFIYDSMENEYYMHEREEVRDNISKMKYDHIFVCLSPQYIPPDHWHYFGMFVNAYEAFSGKKATIHINKYGHMHRLNAVHDKIEKNYS